MFVSWTVGPPQEGSAEQAARRAARRLQRPRGAGERPLAGRRGQGRRRPRYRRLQPELAHAALRAELGDRRQPAGHADDGAGRREPRPLHHQSPEQLQPGHRSRAPAQERLAAPLGDGALGRAQVLVHHPAGHLLGAHLVPAAEGERAAQGQAAAEAVQGARVRLAPDPARLREAGAGADVAQQVLPGVQEGPPIRRGDARRPDRRGQEARPRHGHRRTAVEPPDHRRRLGRGDGRLPGADQGHRREVRGAVPGLQRAARRSPARTSSTSRICGRPGGRSGRPSSPASWRRSTTTAR